MLKWILGTYKQACLQVIPNTCSHHHMQILLAHAQLHKMLTIPENGHNSRKCSQLHKTLTTPQNAHNSRKWSQLQKMLTAPQNAHNSRKCLQLHKLLTTSENTHNSTKCSQHWNQDKACSKRYILHNARLVPFQLLTTQNKTKKTAKLVRLARSK